MGGWVGTKAGLNAMVKRKIPSPCRQSNKHNILHDIAAMAIPCFILPHSLIMDAIITALLLLNVH
jgi:hypothetical protein